MASTPPAPHVVVHVAPHEPEPHASRAISHGAFYCFFAVVHFAIGVSGAIVGNQDDDENLFDVSRLLISQAVWFLFIMMFVDPTTTIRPSARQRRAMEYASFLTVGLEAARYCWWLVLLINVAHRRGRVLAMTISHLVIMFPNGLVIRRAFS